MTTGTVTKLQAYVGLTLGGHDLRCLIDTGFTGHLASWELRAQFIESGLVTVGAIETKSA